MEHKVQDEAGEVHISKEEQNIAVIQEWDKCRRFPKERLAGVYCNQTFDDIACWPDTPAGTVQYIACPTYIQGFYTDGNATRICLPDGKWFVNPVTNSTWSNYSQCLKPTNPQEEIPQLFMVHIVYIRVMSTTGYAISFCSLLLAVFIMVKFKRLHCPRNTVHLHMFVSFILRAILTFLKDLLLVQGLGFAFDLEQTGDKLVFKQEGLHWECKLLITLFHYVLSANYMWILVEGLYLHTLVYVSVFSERSTVRWYYLLGWGTPFLSIVPWVIVRITLENILCWNTNPTVGYFWILKGPIWLSIMVNFFFFINILRALFYKLHKPKLRKPCPSAARHNRYRRLAKATLILIPLFGVHYIVFMGVSENVNPTTEVVILYIEMFFNSFQGFLVAVLFCFLNREVQLELKKTWYRLWSRPDPLFLQQTQYLVDHRNRSHASDNHHSSEGSTDNASCLCKWSLDDKGKLTRTFVKTGSAKQESRRKGWKITVETRM
ncbi:secretin receptor-like [Mya arenaria]|uniref:secretin receptor-like n=1 Tax=Mya arenaria TaxID=6604 RepID=UPI0022DECB21|nr:secretin receptor-like [Mya arenaria]